MKKNVIKMAFIAALIVAGYSYNNQQTEVITDLMFANVEALAGMDPEPDDNGCVKAQDLCSVLVIYSDGCWGEDIFYDKTKELGWL